MVTEWNVCTKTCFKNLEKPSCIDLILTNRYISFIGTTNIETGLSDHHKMTLTVMRAYFPKAKPKCITYRSYHNFDKDYFRYGLNNALKNANHYKIFEEVYLAILNKHAPIKKKFIRANERPFMNKALKKNYDEKI